MKSATQRLKQDYKRLVLDPVPYIVAHPLCSNILEWHYVVLGPENTPYEDGFFHGKLVFAPEFPFKPPSIYMITPNGRFKTNTRLCLSISDFHPDTWNPAWSVATILTGLLSFMLEKSPTVGSVDSTDKEKRQFAYDSLEFNIRDKIFVELFPDLVDKIKGSLRNREAEKTRNRDVIVSSNLASGVNQVQSTLGSFLANIMVIVGFAAFAFVVNYVYWLSKES